MVRGVVLLVLLVLFGAFDVPGIERVRVRYLANAGNTCNACRMHEEIRALSLKAIKEQILNKLGLKQAPNMTGRALPRIPPISKLMDMYGMQADQPQPLEPGISHHEEIDEYAAKTESVFALAQPRKFLQNFPFLRSFQSEYFPSCHCDCDAPHESKWGEEDIKKKGKKKIQISLNFSPIVSTYIYHFFVISFGDNEDNIDIKKNRFH